jgi:hypothetical protein
MTINRFEPYIYFASFSIFSSFFPNIVCPRPVYIWNCKDVSANVPDIEDNAIRKQTTVTLYFVDRLAFDRREERLFIKNKTE